MFVFNFKKEIIINCKFLKAGWLTFRPNWFECFDRIVIMKTIIYLFQFIPTFTHSGKCNYFNFVKLKSNHMCRIEIALSFPEPFGMSYCLELFLTKGNIPKSLFGKSAKEWNNLWKICRLPKKLKTFWWFVGHIDLKNGLIFRNCLKYSKIYQNDGYNEVLLIRRICCVLLNPYFEFIFLKIDILTHSVYLDIS